MIFKIPKKEFGRAPTGQAIRCMPLPAVGHAASILRAADGANLLRLIRQSRFLRTTTYYTFLFVATSITAKQFRQKAKSLHKGTTLLNFKEGFRHFNQKKRRSLQKEANTVSEPEPRMSIFKPSTKPKSPNQRFFIVKIRIKHKINCHFLFLAF